LVASLSESLWHRNRVLAQAALEHSFVRRQYRQVCKALADRIGCDLRTLDRALYEYGVYLLKQKKKSAAA
jgi:hypothetical protein